VLTTTPNTPPAPYDVIIVGCGPTGAMLAAELRLHDVSVLVLERETEPASFVRIVSLHMRSIEIMAMRGLLDRIRRHARQRPAAGFFAAITKPAPEGLDSAHAYLLGIPQPVIDSLLREHAVELGAQVRRGSAVTDVQQDDGGVTVTLTNGEQLRSRYLVGCDGARSTVRRLQPRVVSECRWARLSWKVHSRFQRPAYRVTIVPDPILGSVV